MMASPDVRPYVDLTLFDESAQTIYLNALDYARIALPEYQPREGTIESVLLQAFAREVQDAISSINRLPGAITEILLRLLDVQRSVGSKATAMVKFVGQTTTSFDVPSGTRLYYKASSNSEPVLLQTTAAVTATQAKAISTISQTTTTVSVTTGTMHGLSVGDVVTISGTGVANLDNNLASRTVTAVGATGYTFTVTSTFSGTLSATAGTVTPAATIPATGFVTAETTALTDVFNGLSAGTALAVLSTVPSVTAAYLATTLSGGAATETDTEYFSRATSTLSRLSAALVTTAQIEQYVIESGTFPDVYRVKAVNNTTSGRVGNFAGRVLVAVAAIDGSSSNLLSGIGDGSIGPTNSQYGVLDLVYDGVTTRLQSSLQTAITHPAYVTVAVTANISVPDGVSASAASTACNTTLLAYLSPNTWDWGATVRQNEITVQLRNTTVDVGTITYSATKYISSVSVVPTDFYVPSTSSYNRWTVATRARDGSNVATITTSSAHGMSIGVNEILYIKVAGMSDSSFNTIPTGGFVVQALSASGNTFTYSNTGTTVTSTAETTGYVMALAKKNTVTGDITLLDPAPLVISGTHTITVS